MVYQPLYGRGLTCAGFTAASSMREILRRKNLDRIMGDGAESQQSFQTSESVRRVVCQRRTHGTKELTGTTADRVDVVAIVIVQLLVRNFSVEICEDTSLNPHECLYRKRLQMRGHVGYC